MLKKIPFTTDPKELKDLFYNDNVYAWLLLHSHYNTQEKHNYIYRNSFTFVQIAEDIHRHRETVSKRFKELIEKGIITQSTYHGKVVYKMPYEKSFEELDGETTLKLLTLPLHEYKEELIKTYAYLLSRKRLQKKEDIEDGYDCAPIVYTSAHNVMQAFGHSAGHRETFDRFRLIFTILQGAGIIKFEITPFCKKPNGDFDPSQMRVYQINKRASDEWLGVAKNKGINPEDSNEED